MNYRLLCDIIFSTLIIEKKYTGIIVLFLYPAGGTIDMHIINNLSEAPAACIILSTILYLFSHLLVYLLLNALLKMHRSKSAVKKIKKEYTFIQRMQLLPYKTNCLHAVTFCKGLILFQQISNLFFALYLLLALLVFFSLLSNTLFAWFSVGMIVLCDIPVFVVNGILARPLIGRFKEYSFEKYHNTDDHESLL